MRRWLWIVPILASAGWCQSLPETSSDVTIPSGQQLNVRVQQTLDTDHNIRGDEFTATLVDPVTVDGAVVLPAGTQLSGQVLQNIPAGIWKGRASLMLGLNSVQIHGRAFDTPLTAATLVSPHKHKHLETADPNLGSAAASRLLVTLPAGAIVHFTLGAPLQVPAAATP